MSQKFGADMWDERFAGEEFAYGLRPNAYLAAQRDRLRPGMAALVPGDGEGRNGVWLAEQGLFVDTLDLSANGTAKALRHAQARGVSINARQADALQWDWPRARYDLIALIYLHLIAPQRRRLHALALAALMSGGLIVLEAFRPEQIERQRAGARGGPRDAALLYSAADLREDFAGADIVELEEASVNLAEGDLHVGPSAVVRAIFRAR
jgi:hypothetical protein